MNDTRERIVAATTELFRSQGFNGTSLKQITSESDATIGSVYHFFPGGKEDLASAVLIESGAAYQNLLVLIADESTDIVAAVGAFFDGAADALEASDFIDICPIGTVAREIASTNESLRVASQTVFADWTAELARRLGESGITEQHATELATTIISTIEGGFILARAAKDTTGLRATGRHMRALTASILPR